MSMKLQELNLSHPFGLPASQPHRAAALKKTSIQKTARRTPKETAPLSMLVGGPLNTSQPTLKRDPSLMAQLNSRRTNAHVLGPERHKRRPKKSTNTSMDRFGPAPQAPAVAADPKSWKDCKTDKELALWRQKRSCSHYGVSVQDYKARIPELNTEVRANLQEDSDLSGVQSQVLNQLRFDNQIMLPRENRSTGLMFSGDNTPNAEEDVGKWYRNETWPGADRASYELSLHPQMDDEKKLTKASVDFFKDRDPGQRKTIVLVGHGASASDGRGLSLNHDGYDAENVLNPADDEYWRQVGAQMQSGDAVVLNSCFAGDTPERQRAWANTVKAHFPEGARLYVPIGLVNEAGGAQEGWLKLGK